MGYCFAVGGESQPVPSEYDDSPISISSDSSGLSLLFVCFYTVTDVSLYSVW